MGSWWVSDFWAHGGCLKYFEVDLIDEKQARLNLSGL